MGVDEALTTGDMGRPQSARRDERGLMGLMGGVEGTGFEGQGQGVMAVFGRNGLDLLGFARSGDVAGRFREGKRENHRWTEIDADDRGIVEDNRERIGA